MNHTDVIRTEVADRMRAIGSLGQRVAEGRLSPAEALDLADTLIIRAWRHLKETDATK